MTKGICSNCGREAPTLQKCLGTCRGDALYCNKSCQKNDRKQHKKICPIARGGKSTGAHPLTFTIRHPAGHPFARLPDAPVKALRRMDGYGGSGMTLLFSDHLGVDPLVPYVKEILGENDEEDIYEQARWLGNQTELPYESHVTVPVDPKIMKLKPEEACFNTNKYSIAVEALLHCGIITDTGKRVQIGYYPEKFPICRIHAPQTDNVEMIRRQQKEQEDMLAKLGFNTAIHLDG